MVKLDGRNSLEEMDLVRRLHGKKTILFGCSDHLGRSALVKIFEISGSLPLSCSFNDNYC